MMAMAVNPIHSGNMGDMNQNNHNLPPMPQLHRMKPYGYDHEMNIHQHLIHTIHLAWYETSYYC